MNLEVNNLFVTRQDTFNQKIVEAYVLKENEANNYRQQIEMMLQTHQEFYQLKSKNESLQSQNNQLKDEQKQMQIKHSEELAQLKDEIRCMKLNEEKLYLTQTTQQKHIDDLKQILIQLETRNNEAQEKSNKAFILLD